jgi:zinc D-Ala-D-Ala dipeptidase
MIYKITKQSYYLAAAVLFFFNILYPAYAQDITPNEYGLQVISTPQQYKKSIKGDRDKAMTDLAAMVPGIVLDLKYATVHNFTQKQLYPSGQKTFLRCKAALALQKVQTALKTRGLGLKVFDAYRPYSATKLMWEIVKDDRYAADPRKGSGHNRGAAIDLTIIDLATGKELVMPTAFDDFTEKAHHDYPHLTAEQLANRQLLKDVMEQYGFKALDTEWWHYYWPENKTYDLLDLSFEELGRIV